MKLIDAEDFGRVIREYCKDCIEHNKQKMDIVDINADIQDFLDNQPTAFDVDKVEKELEKSHFHTDATFDDDGYCNDDSEEVVNLNEAIEIVKAGEIDES